MQIPNEMPKTLIPSQGQQKLWKEKIKKQTKKWSNCTLVMLDHKPHRSQLKNKMLKNKRNDKSKVNDVSVIGKRKENIRKENAHKIA